MPVPRVASAISWVLLCVAGVASGMSRDEYVIATYPHIAGSERSAAIRAGYAKIEPGMSSAEVREVLGEPDEVRPLYAPMAKKPDVIGQTYWYVLRRLVADGSQSERQESVVRVSFDLDGVVTGVDAWGLE